MPELPEVETIRRIIGPQIKERKIEKVTIYHEGIISYPDAATFQNTLEGLKITDLRRRGKFLMFVLEDDSIMVLHLRMTGQVLVMDAKEEVEKHTHVVFLLENGKELRYIDVRRFGRFWLGKEEDGILDLSGISKLGIEPDDQMLTGEYMKNHVTSPKCMVKEYLLNQSIVCGIGNIYADEILFDSGIYPGKKCRNLSMEEWDKLAESIPKIIAWGLEADRMTPEEYLKRKGKDYSNILGLKAYGREKKSCVICGSSMEKMIIQGRSSCYCPVCQPEEFATREDLLDFGLNLSDTYKDIPFHDENWVLVRHKKNKKAFLWTYIYEEKLRINVKVDPEWRDFWRETYESVIPGYHQNKEHWNTIIVEGDVPAKELKRMILESYDLTAPKKRKKVKENDI